MDDILDALVDIAQAGRAPQPDDALHGAKRMLLDSIGCALGSHPSDYIPAAMAQLGAEEIPGELVLRGILVGYEIFCRLTDATRLGVEQIDHVLNGAVASAAAASVVNGLSSVQTRHALSLAVTANLSLQATRLGELSMWKGCAAGNACRNGVFAAELAAAGITGPQAPFTGLEEKFREQAESVWELDQAGTPEGLFAWTATIPKEETAVAG
jgi:2-methylcitrate dehydratase PrpD